MMDNLLQQLDELLVKIEVVDTPDAKKRKKYSREEILESAQQARATFSEEELNRNPNNDFQQRPFV